MITNLESLSEEELSHCWLFVGWSMQGSGISQGQILVGKIRPDHKPTDAKDSLSVIEPVVFGRMITADPKGGIMVRLQPLEDGFFPVERDREVAVNVSRFEVWDVLDPRNPKHARFFTSYQNCLNAALIQAAGLHTANQEKPPATVSRLPGS